MDYMYMLFGKTAVNVAKANKFDVNRCIIEKEEGCCFVFYFDVGEPFFTDIYPLFDSASILSKLLNCSLDEAKAYINSIVPSDVQE